MEIVGDWQQQYVRRVVLSARNALSPTRDESGPGIVSTVPHMGVRHYAQLPQQFGSSSVHQHEQTAVEKNWKKMRNNRPWPEGAVAMNV